MAHPLTQHPPSALPFTAASRPSVLGFGFGFPSSSTSSLSSTPAFATQARLPSGNVSHVAFGSPASPYKRPAVSVRTGNTPHVSLKRPRRSASPSSSPSPSPSSSELSSPSNASGELPKGRANKDLSVGSLALKDEDRRTIASRKAIKRVRTEEAGPTRASAQDMDVGVLLAALPASAHLPILLGLVEANPTLASAVLSRIPQLDLDECLHALDKSLDKIKRVAGFTSPGADLSRGWKRAHHEVANFCRMAMTYLNYFASSTGSGSAPDPQTIHSMLRATTLHIYSLLIYIPSPDSDIPSAKPLLDLAKSTLSSWTAWVSALSQEVNQRGGMFPHTSVSAWADSIDLLAGNTLAQQQHWSGGGGGTFSLTAWPSSSSSSNDHPVVLSFRSAFAPVREKFINELGWLVGRQGNGPPIPSVPPPAMNFGQSWARTAVTNIDEEL
ncbi:hypothetical protein BCR39DRAFT_518954 [Naematelia encephala]|uniref:Uncharacterized protein n=1 Tax=Naematelia encephala TaxID=71784 RepID=A0A1Y2BGM7_9TREE|nr:hypothetical protein BCR39DRAFT_518954 [Naematelia encephala]